jgi:hypothetical protein
MNELDINEALKMLNLGYDPSLITSALWVASAQSHLR